MRHRISAIAWLLCLIPAWLAVLVAPAGARVTDADLQRAAAALEAARAAAGDAGEELAGGRAAAARLRASLEHLVDEVASAEVRYDAAKEEARARARALYVGADRTGVLSGGFDADAAVRRTYAAAVAGRDLQVLNALAVAAADLARLQESLRERAREQAELAGRLEELAAAAGTALAQAEADYARVRASWEAQEAARRAAEAAAAAAARTTTTTTTSPIPTTTTTTTTTVPPGGSTTTTTIPEPVEGGAFPPLVERWRPLVAKYFPAEMVDEALAVIRCESSGDPTEVHPVTGAAGLFQHMPRYWPSRAAAAGFPGASALEPEPNIAAAWWLARTSLEDGLPAWYFWSCKP